MMSEIWDGHCVHYQSSMEWHRIYLSGSAFIRCSWISSRALQVLLSNFLLNWRMWCMPCYILVAHRCNKQEVWEAMPWESVGIPLNDALFASSSQEMRSWAWQDSAHKNFFCRTEMNSYRTGRMMEYTWHIIFGEAPVMKAVDECALLRCDDRWSSAPWTCSDQHKIGFQNTWIISVHLILSALINWLNLLWTMVCLLIGLCKLAETRRPWLWEILSTQSWAVKGFMVEAGESSIRLSTSHRLHLCPPDMCAFAICCPSGTSRDTYGRRILLRMQRSFQTLCASLNFLPLSTDDDAMIFWRSGRKTCSIL